MYDVTFRLLRLTIFAVEKQQILNLRGGVRPNSPGPALASSSSGLDTFDVLRGEVVSPSPTSRLRGKFSVFITA
jgi:hypothetical protein